MPEHTMRIGQEVVRRKLASLEQVRDCLAAQEELRGRGQDVPLGQVLVARGVLPLEDLKEVLSSLNLLLLYCPSCQNEHRVKNYKRRNEYLCNYCSTELIFTTTRLTAPGVVTPAPRAPAAGDKEKADPLIGRKVGGCMIRRRIASGGMGTVYEAEQINLGRTVALKVLAPDLAADENFVRRFLLEARAAAALSHINIIHINDAGQEEGIFYYTMEFVAGENLSQRLRREQRLAVPEALRITAQVADALHHAHAREIIHRDIKPENIMLTTEGRVKLADLGLAKKVMGDTQTTITQPGSILGTPYYMAPEQARDFATADARSDLYSLGVTLYKMLTGHVPFTGASPIEVMIKAFSGTKKSVAELVPEIAGEVSELVDKMMHVNPAYRFANAAEARDEILEVSARLVTK
ncbi:MAG: serine/threonine protein kinase [Planctomycetes bacterium]|nr:serine/threonine protein kinase [Planctomycetota bacterium]